MINRTKEGGLLVGRHHCSFPFEMNLRCARETPGKEQMRRSGLELPWITIAPFKEELI